MHYLRRFTRPEIRHTVFKCFSLSSVFVNPKYPYMFVFVFVFYFSFILYFSFLNSSAMILGFFLPSRPCAVFGK